jgi:hypothetical protein
MMPMPRRPGPGSQDRVHSQTRASAELRVHGLCCEKGHARLSALSRRVHIEARAGRMKTDRWSIPVPEAQHRAPRSCRPNAPTH